MKCNFVPTDDMTKGRHVEVENSKTRLAVSLRLMVEWRMLWSVVSKAAVSCKRMRGWEPVSPFMKDFR